MKEIKKLLFIPVFLFGFIDNSQAQRGYDFLKISYTNITSDEVTDLFQTPVFPVNTFKGTKVGIGNFYLQAAYHLKLGETTTIVAKPEYDLVSFQYDNWPDNVDTKERTSTLHSLNFTLGLKQQFGSGWGINLFATPGLATDFNGNLDSDDFIFQGNGFISKSFNDDETLSLGLGASYNYLLGEKKIMPLLDFFWQTEKFKMDIFAPYYGKIYFIPVEKLEIGLAGHIKGNLYQIDFTEDVPNSVYNKVSYNAIYGGPSINWNITGKLFLNLEGGIVANRTYEVNNTEGKKIADFDTKKFQSYFFGLGISIKN